MHFKFCHNVQNNQVESSSLSSYGRYFSRWLFPQKFVTFLSTLRTVCRHFLCWLNGFNLLPKSIMSVAVGISNFWIHHLMLSTWKVPLNMEVYCLFNFNARLWTLLNQWFQLAILVNHECLLQLVKVSWTQHLKVPHKLGAKVKALKLQRSQRQYHKNSIPNIGPQYVWKFLIWVKWHFWTVWTQSKI